MKNSYFLSFIICLLLCLFTSEIAKSGIETNPQAVAALGKCLKSKNAKMFGAKKCSHCNHNKEMFLGNFDKYVQFIDCRESANGKAQCKAANVGPFPKWTFNNGQEITRPTSLEALMDVADCRDQVLAEIGGEAMNSYQTSSNSGNYGTSEDLAKCLVAKDVYFYGSPVCSHCSHGKEAFGGNFEKYLYKNFKDCAGSAKKECVQLNTFPFPTWYQPSTGKKLARPETLELIASTFGCNGVQPQVIKQPEINTNNTFDVIEVKPQDSPYEPLQQQESLPMSNKAVFDFKNETAKCLIGKNLSLYIKAGDKYSVEQLNELGEVINSIKLIDCSKAENTSQCKDITTFPTWKTSKGSLFYGFFDIENLYNTNCQ